MKTPSSSGSPTASGDGCSTTSSRTTRRSLGDSVLQDSSRLAAQRIKDLSLRSAIMNAIGGAGSRTTSSLIDQFQYPRLGPGQLWERCRDLIVDAGGEVRMNHPVHAVQHDGSKVLSVRVHAGDGETREVHGTSSSPPCPSPSSSRASTRLLLGR